MRRPNAGSVSFDNRGRVAVVSGGAQGIGQAVCEAWLESGGQLLCIDVKETQPQEPSQQRAIYFQGDTSRERDCQTAVQQAVERFGGVDVLVNNAAIQPPESYVPLDQLERTEWDRMVGINFSGYTFLAKHAVRVMLQQRSGVIVNIASGQAHRTARHVPCYGPIKAANILQTMQWAVEYARQGIRVASVSPGAIRTPLVAASLDAQGGEKSLANRHPVGRLGEAPEVAQAVLFLASPAAAFITGTDLAVDGGLGALGAFADPYPDEEDHA